MCPNPALIIARLCAGALGVRTTHQTEAKAQLLVRVKGSPSPTPAPADADADNHSQGNINGRGPADGQRQAGGDAALRAVTHQGVDDGVDGSSAARRGGDEGVDAAVLDAMGNQARADLVEEESDVLPLPKMVDAEGMMRL